MTKIETLRRLFVEGVALSHLTAHQYAGTYRLADVVYKLKKRGYRFRDTVLQDAQGVTYKKYQMTHLCNGEELW